VSSPVVLNNVLYFVCANNKVYALDIANGKKIWSYKLTFPNTLGASIISPLLVTVSGQAISAFSGR